MLVKLPARVGGPDAQSIGTSAGAQTGVDGGAQGIARRSSFITVLGAGLASRVLIWVVGSIAVLALGTSSGAVGDFDPSRVSLSFGGLGNVLAAPAVRWDSIWYLHIAAHGYQSARDAAFYPLYPLLVRAGSTIVGSPALAGVLISVSAMLAGLEIVRRLTELELGPAAARATVALIAFGPMALFLSAVYTESLFLALSAGTLYAARRERWALAGVLGGLAATTRVTGVLLIVPVVLMFFYGPRTAPGRVRAAAHRFAPRYSFSPAVLWSALIPAGAALFAGYLALRGFGVNGTLHAQAAFSDHDFVGPFTGAWDGLLAAWHELRLVASGVGPPTGSSQALLQFGGLMLAVLAVIGTLRVLPLAYGAYAILGVLIPLSSPTAGDPLRGLDRYTSLLFPLFMWAGAWAVQRRALRPLLLVSGAVLIYFSIQFATWHWVGSSAI